MTIRASMVSSTPTTSLTPLPSITPLPSLTPTESFLDPSRIVTLGKGEISGIFRSPDGRIAAMSEGNILYWFNSGSFEELGSIESGEERIFDMYFSPDSQLIALEGYSSAEVVDLEGQTLIGRISGWESVICIRFTSDNLYAVYLNLGRSTGGPYHSIGVWNIAEDRYEHTFPVLSEERYHTLTCPALSPDDKWVAAGYRDNTEDVLYIWDLQSGETIFAIDGHSSKISDVDISPYGDLLASGSHDATVRLWNPETGELVRVITGFMDDIEWVDFSEDGRSLKVDVGDQPGQVYDLRTGRLSPAKSVAPTIDPFKMHIHQQGYSEDVYGTYRVLFSPNGRYVALSSSHILIWDNTTMELISALETNRGQAVTGMAYSPDGKLLAAVNEYGDIFVWEISTGRMKLRLTGESLGMGQVVAVSGGSGLGPGIGSGVHGKQGIDFSIDGKRLAFGNGLAIEVWDIQSAKRVMVFERTEKPSFATRVSFSEDGTRLYAALNRNRAAGIWDTESGALLREIYLPPVNQNALSVTDLRGPYFVRNNHDGDQYWLEIWNLDEEEYVRIGIPSGEEPVRLSQDARLLITQDREWIYFWKVETGDLIYMMKNEAGLADIDISSDSKTLAVAHDGVVDMWDIRTIESYSSHQSFSPAIMPPTPTSSYQDWPTPTPQPKLMVTPLDLPRLHAGALSPENASKAIELASFGRGTIEQAVWSLDGKEIVSAGSEGVYTYDSATLKEKDRLENGAWIEAIVSARDGRLLAAGMDDDQVQVWDVTEDTLLFNHQGWGELALSPDVTLVVFLNNDANMQTWELNADQPVALLRSNSEMSSAPIFSPNNRLVAAIQSDDSVRVWNAQTGEIVNALGGPDSDISTLSFSDDGQFLVGAGAGSAWIWDVRPGYEPSIIALYEGEIDGNLTRYDFDVTAAALSPDNNFIAIGTTERDVLLYDRESLEFIRGLERHSNRIDLLRFSPDGRRLLSVDRDGVMMVWDVDSGQLITENKSHTGAIEGVVFRLDGHVAAWEGNTAWVIRARDGALIRSTSIREGAILAVSPAGDWLAVYAPYQMSLWDARTGELKATLAGMAKDVWVEYYWEGLTSQGFYGAQFSDDGTRLVTLGTGGAWVYNTSNDGLLNHFNGNNARKADISRDNRWLVTALHELAEYPKILNIQTGETLISLDGRSWDYPQYAFSPNGLQVGAVKLGWREENAEFVMFDVATGQIEMSLPISIDAQAISLAFNPDGSLVVIGQEDGKLLIVDVASLEVVVTLEGHKGAVEHLAFSQDGRYIASGSVDGTVRIWGVP